jgi:hypothetical protein
MHVPVTCGAAAYLPHLSRPPELASGPYVTLSPLNKAGAEMGVVCCLVRRGPGKSTVASVGATPLQVLESGDLLDGVSPRNVLFPRSHIERKP